MRAFVDAPPEAGNALQEACVYVSASVLWEKCDCLCGSCGRISLLGFLCHVLCLLILVVLLLFYKKSFADFVAFLKVFTSCW